MSLGTRGTLAAALAFFLTTFAWAGGSTGVTEQGAAGSAVEVALGTYREAPMLTELVAAGQLPPVDQRLPIKPAVLEPLEEVGRYGGTLHVFTNNNMMWGDAQEEPERGNFLLRMKQDGSIVPDIARDVQLADDHRSMTIFLREGMRWSDGHPFSADDVLFMYNDMHRNELVQTWGFRSFITEAVKLDDDTVRLQFDAPHPEYYLSMVEWRGSGIVSFHPRHYLEKWHIEYNPDANTLAKQEGFDDWSAAFHHHYWWGPPTDIDKPTTQPWLWKELTTTHKVFERNPYYHMVDTAAQQLPYIDTILTEIVDPELYNIKVISGEADIAFANTSVENYSLYRQNEQAGGYRTVVIPGINGSETAYAVNVNHPDPVLRSLYGDLRFRQALSLAIDRQEINEVAYFGLGTPRQATVVPDVSYYDPRWGEEHSFAHYDPAAANQLLDAVGLTERDRRGIRLRPDGKPLQVVVEVNVGGEGATPTKVHELVKEYWQEIGVQMDIKPFEAALFGERGRTPNHEIRAYVMSNTGEFYAYVSQAFVWSPKSHGGSWGRGWGIWLEANDDVQRGVKQLADFEGGVLPGEEPPQEIKDLWQLIYYQFSNAPFGSERYVQAAKELFDYHAEQLYIIGTVGLAPTLYVAKNNVRNVPTRYAPHFEVNLNFNYYLNQLFFE